MSRRVVIDELEFEVPYGKLAAKTWHEETDESKRVLALHGWMDNAGSFDTLMPQLKHKDGLYIVALDLPGHGKSSQLPPGASYSDIHIVMEVRRCIRELKWNQSLIKRDPSEGFGGGIGGGGRMSNSSSRNSVASMVSENSAKPRKKFTILGHSLGAGLALFYASLFPEDIEEIVLMDFLKAKTPPAEMMLRSTAENIDQFIEIVPAQSPFASPVLAKANSFNNFQNSHNQSAGRMQRELKQADKGQVIVSQEAAIVATIEAHKVLGILTRDDAACLLKRSTVAVNTPPNSVIFSRDLRLQSMLNLRENFEGHKTIFANISSNLIIILGKRGMYSEDELFRDRMDEIEEFYRSKTKNFRLQWIDSDHYMHMNKSKQTAEIVNKYLESPKDYVVTPLTSN